MTAPVAAGDVLGGKYRVERVLGEGGMGVVVAATHMQLQERVALKFLLLSVSEGSELATRFLREAQAAFKIKSEHVARVTDVGTLESGVPYMVMEYLEGQDLEAIVKRTGPLPVPLSIEYLLQASEAIAEAHKAGIVHRDLKPANLFLTHRSDGSPCVKVLDFGISKVSAQGLGKGANLTRTAGIMGTPVYMSPEQLRSSRDVDARADIWSLGVILFELLTGRVPFAQESVAELCAAILTQPAPRLRSLREQVPEGVDAIVARCLKKDPEDRYANVGELARALAAFAPDHLRPSVDRIVRTSQPDAARATLVSGPDPQAFAPTITPIADTEAPTRDLHPSDLGLRRSRPAALALAAGALLLLLAGLGVGLASTRAHPAPEPERDAIATAPPAPPPPIVAAAPAGSQPPPTPIEDAPPTTAPAPAAATARRGLVRPGGRPVVTGSPAPRQRAKALGEDGDFGGRK
jgi:serine/threonine-protein kinase